MNLVTRVGLEWKRRSAAPKGADACSGLGEPYHCTRNGNDVLIDPPALLLAWEIARRSEARDIRESFRPRYFAMNASGTGERNWVIKYHLPWGLRLKNRKFAVVLLNFLRKPLTFVSRSMVLRPPGGHPEYFYE